MPREITHAVRRDVALLRHDSSVRDAVRAVIDSGLPALPVVADGDRFAGIFGEREFMQALFPGYIDSLKGAGFVGRPMEDVLEKRSSCATEPVAQYMNDERIAVDEDFSDLQVAEVFLHHRVLIVPVLGPGKRVAGVVTRSEFFRALGERFLAPDVPWAG
jgi:CBS domain-containing protein